MWFGTYTTKCLSTVKDILKKCKNSTTSKNVTYDLTGPINVWMTGMRTLTWADTNNILVFKGKGAL